MTKEDFPDALRRFEDWMAVKGWSDRTRHKYRYELTCFYCDWCALRGVPVGAVTERDVNAYVAGLAAHGLKRGDAMRALKAFYRWADGRIRADDPTHDMKIPRRKPTSAPSLGREAERRLLRAAFRHEPRRGWAIVLALSTGARVSQLCALRREDVHLDDPNGPWVWWRLTKGDRPYELPLNRRAALAAEHLLEFGHDPLLGVGAARFRQWVHEAEQVAGLERVWPHLFRHTFATRLAASGDVEAWREGMNHADLSQWPVYVARSRRRLRAALEQA